MSDMIHMQIYFRKEYYIYGIRYCWILLTDWRPEWTLLWKWDSNLQKVYRCQNSGDLKGEKKKKGKDLNKE